METFITSLNNIIWSDALIYLCLGSGVFFSFMTAFPQLRLVPEMIRLIFDGKSSKTGVSSFQALAIAISGRVGTGNIAGVATAIAMGGPGAVFWMWTIAFLGAAPAFIEATLGQIYKVVQDGEYRGGPAYYIERGLGMKRYAIVFSAATVLCMAFFLPGVQSNSIASGVTQAFDVPASTTGGVLVLLLAVVVFGGVKRIGAVAQVVVPFMAFAYIAVATVIIVSNLSEVPTVFHLIVDSAFGAEPLFGGIVGLAIAWGVQRGIFSNEAGQGTAPHAAAAAEVSHPAKQGLVQAFSVYIDTLLVCSATAFMILFTGSYNVADKVDATGTPVTFLVEKLPGVSVGPEFTQAAIESQFPGYGQAFVAIALCFFAFTTIMAYYYIAETNVSYLGHKRWMIGVLRVLLLAATYYGAVIEPGAAWQLGDVGVGLMAWLNIVAILLLRKPALLALKDYESQRKAGMDPTFDPRALGIQNAEVWERRD
ncbi:MAG: putative sodium/proton-dependent alanine carrier protein YrbD [Planctomycetota bacterium]|nr:MAG: putative sodium/proton-dependent alanine carrier protein YrbD [Planctomycetota bacterium]